ncbi:MAG: effector-associated domain EAD1-containing protein [Polyangiales bacterium]
MSKAFDEFVTRFRRVLVRFVTSKQTLSVLVTDSGLSRVLPGSSLDGPMEDAWHSVLNEVSRQGKHEIQRLLLEFQSRFPNNPEVTALVTEWRSVGDDEALLNPPTSLEGSYAMNARQNTPAILNAFGDGDVAAEVAILPDLFFPDNEISRKALSDKTNLIIGRRGAGKSALACWLGFVREGDRRRYTKHAYVGQLVRAAPFVTGIADRIKDAHHAAEIFAKAWRLALTHALMAEMLTDGAFGARAGALEMEHHLIQRNIPKDGASHVVQRVFEILSKAMTPGISPVASLISSVQELETSQGYVRWLSEVPKYFRETRQRAVIVIDTLEEYTITDSAIRLVLASLLQAVDELCKSELGETVEVKLLMPAEVTQTLEEDTILNIGKSFSRALFMHWRRKDLLRLMCWRFVYHMERKYPALRPSELKLRKDFDWSDSAAIESDIWNRVFPRVHVCGHDVNSFQYISRYTQLRPRQFVLMCNAIVQSALDERRFPSIEPRDIRIGIANVVDTLAAEVLSSFKDVYIDAGRIVSTLATVPDARSLYTGLTYGNIDALAARAKAQCTNEEFWRLLLETGVLGVVTRETDMYVEARFEYVVRERLVPHVHQRFVVHPMFYKRLGVNPTPDAKRVFPLGPEDLDIDY